MAVLASYRTPLGETSASRLEQAKALAALAVQALIDEASLTPKPALVDRRGSGAHRDLDLGRMIRSAQALETGFEEMAAAALGRTEASLALREGLGAIGRRAEQAMMAATGGSNAHRGAIWILGLLVAGAAMAGDAADADTIADRAGALARLPDRFAPASASNGRVAGMRYGVAGARGEAQAGFPHAIRHGLPRLRQARRTGCGEEAARLDALMAIMARLDDTCLLHRAGLDGLDAAKYGAAEVLAFGGTATAAGRAALETLDAELMRRWASPGGSADLLAATLFLDRVGTMSARAGEPWEVSWKS